MGAGRRPRAVHPAALAGMAAFAITGALAALVLSLNEPPPAPAVRLLPPPAPIGVGDVAAEAAPAAVAGTVAQAPARPADSPPPAPAVPPQLLSPGRPLAAAAFLEEVQLAPHPRGGFVVLAVLADSRPARMGLRPGDRLYSLDTPRMAAIDEQSMVALMLQTELELDIYRDGVPMRLALALNHDEADDDDARRSPTDAAGR